MLLKVLILFSHILYIKSTDCPYLYSKEKYRRESLLQIRGLPTNLAYNPNTKDLFFTLIDVETLHNDDVQTKMDQYILKDGVPTKIDNVNGQAAAVDVKNNRVYVATDAGLTVLNETNKANLLFFSLKDHDITQLFKPAYRDVLYAIFYPDNDVYMIDIVKNQRKKIDHIPCAFIVAVDSDDNVYYESSTKFVSVLIKGFQEPIEFVGIPKNAARAFSLDEYNNIILATTDGLYNLRSNNMIPKKFMDLEYVPSGLTFGDKDIFIGTNGIIYKYTKTGC